jgi:hypothetical protein
MAFWSSPYEVDAADPKRGYRFKIIFKGAQGTQDLVWWAKKVSKPSFDVTETKHVFLDKHFYFPGRVDWQTVSMTLVDPVSPIDAVAQTNLMLEGMGYNLADAAATPGDLSTMSKGKANGAMGVIQIIQLDSDGNNVEEWELKNPFLKNVKYGELSYESDDLVEIEIELRYDWATCTVKGKSTGAQDLPNGTTAASKGPFFDT